jgi:hypothetical protein
MRQSPTIVISNTAQYLPANGQRRHRRGRLRDHRQLHPITRSAAVTSVGGA